MKRSHKGSRFGGRNPNSGLDKRAQAKNREEESTMFSKTLCIAGMIVLATFALSSAARAASCSNASVSGIYGSLGEGTNPAGQPEANLFQFDLNPSTGEFTGTDQTGASVSGTYQVTSDCTIIGTTTKGESTHPFSAVVTSTGLQSVSENPGATNGGFWVAQGSPTCTTAGVEGSFGLALRGSFLAVAPFTGPVILIGELELRRNSSGDGVISGHMAGSENGTILTFAEATGSYSVDAGCKGTLTVTPKGESALNFSFVIVDGGKEMLAIETDANTVVTGTLVEEQSSNEDKSIGGQQEESLHEATVNSESSYEAFKKLVQSHATTARTSIGSPFRFFA
jgi:hypothetical protein